MISEKPWMPESISEGKRRLLSLEKEGRYVFHGTTETCGVLEPYQAYNSNPETGAQEKDGGLAVFATPYADVAIFRALINAKDVFGDSRSTFGMNENDEVVFASTENLLEQAKRKIGKIYVLDRNKFRDFKGTDCRCDDVIAPLEVIEVSAADLPKNIQIYKNVK